MSDEQHKLRDKMSPRRKRKPLGECSRKDIINRLNKRFEGRLLAKGAIAAMADEIITRRKDTSNLKRTSRAIRTEWGLVILPLTDQIKSCQSRLSEWCRNAGREDIITFYSQYLGLMLRARDLLRYEQTTARRTPIDYMAEKLARGAASSTHVPPNELKTIPYGTSWVDWVPDKLRVAFLTEQSNFKTKTRPLKPILARAPHKSILQQHNAVRAAWIREQEQLMDIIERDGAENRPHEVLHIQLIQIAVDKIDVAKTNKRITPYWRKLVTLKDREAVGLATFTANREKFRDALRAQE